MFLKKALITSCLSVLLPFVASAQSLPVAVQSPSGDSEAVGTSAAGRLFTLLFPLRKYEKHEAAFKLLFGDLLRDAEAGQEPKQDEEYVVEKVPPLVAPEHINSMLNNLCKSEAQDDDPAVSGSIEQCQLNTPLHFKLKCGIRPSVMRVLRNYGNMLEREYQGDETCGSLEEIWEQASLGIKLTGKNIRTFFILNGSVNSDGSLAQFTEEDPIGPTAEMLKLWCAASSASATRKLYDSLASEAEMALHHSSTSSETEMLQILSLIRERQNEVRRVEINALKVLLDRASSFGLNFAAAHVAEAQPKTRRTRLQRPRDPSEFFEEFVTLR